MGGCWGRQRKAHAVIMDPDAWWAQTQANYTADMADFNNWQTQNATATQYFFSGDMDQYNAQMEKMYGTQGAVDIMGTAQPGAFQRCQAGPGCYGHYCVPPQYAQNPPQYLYQQYQQNQM